MIFFNWKTLTIIFLASLTVSACGKLEQGGGSRKNTANRFADSVTRDTTLRQADKKWSCSHTPASHRKMTILRMGDTQTLQLETHLTTGETPVTDYLQITGLNCYHSSADSRVVKCFSKTDSTLKIETTMTPFYGLEFDVLTLKLQGLESSFSVYLGGQANRLGTLTEFKTRNPEAFQLRLTAANKCGFEN